MLKIKDLKVNIDGKPLLENLNLQIKPGEIHAIMGPNGSGKSTLAKVISGHPQYEVTGGEALYNKNFKDVDLLSLGIDERAKEGVFMAFQYPVEVYGLNNMNFLHAAFNSLCLHHGTKEMGEKEFQDFASRKAEQLGIDKVFLSRNLNEGFSGGEKKQNEILQMLILSPRLAVLDETDSGLDVDSIQKMSKGIKAFHNKDNALIVITHYHRMLELVRPDFVHIMVKGKIQKTGGFELAEQIEEQGYDWISKELH